MADELDPRLEARLRDALHAEAGQLPLLVRWDDIERARRRRGGRRLALPASLVGLAAVLAILVIVGGAWRASQSIEVGGSPSSPPSERPLASYEDLLAAIGPVDSATLQGEGETPGDAAEAVETDLGSVLVTPSVKLSTSCLGGDLIVMLRADGAEVGTHHIACSAQGPSTSQIDPFAATPPAEAQVVVIAAKGMRWRIVIADPFADGASPDASGFTGPGIVMPSPGSGERPLVRFESDASRPVDTGVAVPEGTDDILVSGQCAGDGEVTIEIDGVRAVYPCADFGPEVFVPDNTWLDIRAWTTGSALVAGQVIARDLERADGVAWIPPKLTLEGPAGKGAGSKQSAYAGCGLGWQPAVGGGFFDDCGPSWQPVAGALRAAPGSTVSLSLTEGWTIDGVNGALAAQDHVLPSGRNPESQPLAIRRTAKGFTFDVPDAGDWSVRLNLTGTKDGDRFSVPYYARVIVEP